MPLCYYEDADFILPAKVTNDLSALQILKHEECG